MPRGGYRKGAGGKPKWNQGKTKVIRVPEVLVDKIIEYAKKLDEGRVEEQKSKVVEFIDLSNVSLISVSGQMSIRLSDLVKKGYEIRPKRLNDIVSASLKANRSKYGL